MHSSLRLCVGSAVVALVVLSATGLPAAPAVRADEVRALWVLRTSLTSPASIEAVVSAADEAGLNTLLVQVRGRGDAFSRSTREPRAAELARQPADFDPLAHLMDRAAARGLRVHAWVNVNLVGSAVSLPSSPAHVVRRFPEWLMLPRALSGTLGRQLPRSPGYVDALARWTRSVSERVEGLYVSPLAPGAQDHMVAVVEELLGGYALDGLHLDYIRFPDADFDYSAAALAGFRASRLPHASTAERERLDRLATSNPAAWADALPQSWEAYRREMLTAFVARLAAAARRARPGVAITAAVWPSEADARRRKLQDWPAWAEAGYLDAVCPMMYTTNTAEFTAQAAALAARLGEFPFWAGVGAYRLSVDQTARHIRIARTAGAAGIALFSYDSLVGRAAPAPGYLPALRPVLLEPDAGRPPRR